MASIATLQRNDSSCSSASNSSHHSNSSSPSSFSFEMLAPPNNTLTRSYTQHEIRMPSTSGSSQTDRLSRSSSQSSNIQPPVATTPHSFDPEQDDSSEMVDEYPDHVSTPLIEPQELVLTPPASPQSLPPNALRREGTFQHRRTRPDLTHLDYADTIVLPPPRSPSPGTVADRALPDGLQHTRRAVRHGIKVRDFAFPETNPIHTGTADPSTLSFVISPPPTIPRQPLFNAENPHLSKLIPGYIGASKAFALGQSWQNPFVDHGFGPRVLDCVNTPGWSGSPGLNPNYGIPTNGKRQAISRSKSPSNQPSSQPVSQLVGHNSNSMDDSEAQRQLEKLNAMRMKRGRSDGSDTSLILGRASKLAKIEGPSSDPRARSSSPIALDDTSRRPRRPTNARRPSNAIYRDVKGAESNKDEEMEVAGSLGLDVMMSSPRLTGVS